MSVHQIIEKQRTFFRDGHTRSLEFRKNQLKQLKKMMNDEKDYFTNAVYKDLRREQRVTFFMEIAMTVTEIDDTLAHLNEWAAPEVVSRTAATLLDTPMIVKDPLGVVLIIAPWNYPVCLVTLPLVSALAAGNTVIIKPSEVSVATSSALAKFIPKYFKPEVVSVVEGGVPETTELLKERFDRILYTGSTSVGKVVMTAAAKHLTPVTLELGGKSPTVVLEDADIATSARRIAWGKWINSGQTCIAPDYIITSSRVKPLLVDAIRKTVDEFYGKDIKTCNDYARMINERQFDRLSNLLATSKGVKLFCGGTLDRDDLFIPPIIMDVEKDDSLMEGELFGPILPILTIDSFDQILEHLAQGEKPLTSYLFSKSQEKIRRFTTEVLSGNMVINDTMMNLTVNTLPFGGVGESGMGRYRGKFGFNEFSHEKAVLKKRFFGEFLNDCRYPPLTPARESRLKLLSNLHVTLPVFLHRLPFAVLFFAAGYFLAHLPGLIEEWRK